MEKQRSENLYAENSPGDTGSRELRIERLLDAPLDIVWKVWTNPAEITTWWGPVGFTNTIHGMDVTAGGEWRLTMHGPDGRNFPNKSTFLEILPREKIVFQHYNPNYLATIVFQGKEDKTHLCWTMVFETKELFDTVVKVFKADEGLNQNADKLENYLKLKMQ